MAKKMIYPLRLDDQDADLLRRVAEHHERERSDLLRWLLRQEARRLGLVEGGAAPDEPPAAPTGPLGFDD